MKSFVAMITPSNIALAMALGAMAFAATSFVSSPARSSEIVDETSKLEYLPGFDDVALQMLSCADVMHDQAGRNRSFLRSMALGMEASYRKAGRAAVVQAALQAPGSPAEPKVQNISFDSSTATALVTNDLRVHEEEAVFTLADMRRGGVGVADNCMGAELKARARKLNDWFANDTAVLKDVH